MSGSPSPSILLVEEYFEAEDERFVQALRGVGSPATLAGFVDRWRRDPRPWAREQALAYLNQPFDVPGHEVVVKRLFKHAVATKEDATVARCMVAFDRLVRQERRTRWQYDWETRRSWQEESLVTRSDTIPKVRSRRGRNPRTGEWIDYGFPPRDRKLFTNRTRYWLRRAAWRYLRHLAYRRPGDYVRVATGALAAYRDEDVERGEFILDCWGLLHCCFRGHDALAFGSTRIRLKPGRSLGELTAAPRFPELWSASEAFEPLLDLLATAQSRLVRVWVTQLLEREHVSGLAALPPVRLLALLEAEDPDVQRFAARLFGNSPHLGTLSLDTWLALLETRNPEVLQMICDAMANHVAADRLDRDGCLRLALTDPAPVARLGFEYLKQRPLDAPDDLNAIARLADARCEALASEMANWAIDRLGTPERYDRDRLLRFFDSRSRPVREAAWKWLTGGGDTPSSRLTSPGAADPSLWCRLLETPYDDIRLPLVDELQRRSALPGVSVDDLAPVWSTVLLGVHRGGRRKPKATRQLAEAIDADRSRAESLLPVLAAAVRSVRGPERRAGLAAVVGLVDAHPDLEPLVRRVLPELVLDVEVA